MPIPVGLDAWLTIGLIAGVAVIFLILSIHKTTGEANSSQNAGPCIFDEPLYGRGNDQEQYYPPAPQAFSEINPQVEHEWQHSFSQTITPSQPQPGANSLHKKHPANSSRFKWFEP